MAVRQLSTALLPHLNTQEQRVINLLSTEAVSYTHLNPLAEFIQTSLHSPPYLKKVCKGKTCAIPFRPDQQDVYKRQVSC